MSAPATLLWLVLFFPCVRVHGETPRQQAQSLEKQGRWFEACCQYDELLAKDRNQPELREAYRRCLRHFRQQRRLDDPVLNSLLNKLTASEAGDLYEQILGAVVKHYADRDRLDLSDLFRQGLGELRASLQKKEFLQKQQGRVSESDLAGFRATLDQWEGEKVPSRAAARSLVRRILVAASQQSLPPGVVALELACGAANSLDEYSLYLAPGRAGAAGKGKSVGIGIEVSLTAQKLEVSRVHRKSPAAEAGLLKGDRITRIDGHAVDLLAPDLALERLTGESGTEVELEVIPRGQGMAQTIAVKRQVVLPVSVDAELRGEMGSYIGYLHIHNFQESTPQEVKEAVARWQGIPLAGVILDLRGNPGGQLKSAISVAELFLPEAIIVHLTHQLPKVPRTSRSHNSSPILLPMAVLVDGETASSAEVLAGALKDNQRAILIGQPTFGKNSVQGTIPLERGPGGVRLTVAKFSLPSRIPFAERGIVPTHLCADPDPEAAIKDAERRLRDLPMMLMQ